MEELLLLAGYHSDTDSIRSTVTASLDVTKIRKRSGRKQQAPRRAAFDSGKASTTVSNHDILLTANQQVQGAVKDEALLPASASAAVGPVLHVNARTAAPAAREKKGKHDISGPCCHCNATSSPQWRKGPKGKPVLCNACGIRFLRNRTLTKVMPKKRRGASAVSGAMVAGDAAAAVVPKVKRSKTEKAPFTQDCGVMLASEEVLVTEDTLTITDDAAEEALSTEAAVAAQRSDIPLAAAAPMSADHIPFKKPAVPQPVAATGSSSSGYEVHEPSVRSCANGVQPLAAGSTHLLLGSNSWLHSSSPLSLALTMHQQRQLEASPRGNLTGSPVSDTSALSPGVRSSAGSLPSSPLLLGAAGTSDAVGQQQYQHQHNTSVWKHLLPAFPPAQQQMTAGCLTSQLLPKPAPLLLAGTTAPPATSALPGQTSPAIDILQLVQQISGVLGGVGPAVEFIKAMQSGGPAAAAALAAAAAAAVAF